VSESWRSDASPGFASDSVEVGTADGEAGAVLPAARAIDLCKTYGAGEVAVRALDGVSVEFERARFTAVMGPSRSGSRR